MVEPDSTQMTNITMQEKELCLLNERGKNRDTRTHSLDREALLLHDNDVYANASHC